MSDTIPMNRLGRPGWSPKLRRWGNSDYGSVIGNRHPVCYRVFCVALTIEGHDRPYLGPVPRCILIFTHPVGRCLCHCQCDWRKYRQIKVSPKMTNPRQMAHQRTGENPCSQQAYEHALHEMSLHAPCEYDECPPRTSPDDVLGVFVIQ